jgi:hypothetical protein
MTSDYPVELSGIKSRVAIEVFNLGVRTKERYPLLTGVLIVLIVS